MSQDKRWQELMTECGIKEMSKSWNQLESGSAGWEYPDGSFHMGLPPQDMNSLWEYVWPRMAKIHNYESAKVVTRWIIAVANEGRDPFQALFNSFANALRIKE